MEWRQTEAGNNKNKKRLAQQDGKESSRIDQANKKDKKVFSSPTNFHHISNTYIAQIRI